MLNNRKVLKCYFPFKRKLIFALRFPLHFRLFPFFSFLTLIHIVKFRQLNKVDDKIMYTESRFLYIFTFP